MKTTWILALVLLATCLGCDDDDATRPSSAGLAELRVAHLSPDAPDVAVWVNGQVALDGVPFPAVSDYMAVPAGETRIQVTPAGSDRPVVIDATVSLADDRSYTVAATGLLADLTPLVLVDDRTPGSAAGVRFVHASPDAPAVDIAVAGGGPVLFSGVDFREVVDYLEVTGGASDLEVRLAGTDTVVLAVPGVTVVAGTNTTIFAIGSTTNPALPGLAALPVSDAP